MRDRLLEFAKGHIAIATSSVFQRKHFGWALNSFARRPLWEIGLDFDHGTGHGVKLFLGVPRRTSTDCQTGRGIVPGAGMVISNEPGFYKEGLLIRIENLEVVRFKMQKFVFSNAGI